MNGGNNAFSGEDNEQKDPRLTRLTEFFSYPDREPSCSSGYACCLKTCSFSMLRSLCRLFRAKASCGLAGKELYALEVIDGSTITRKMTHGPHPGASSHCLSADTQRLAGGGLYRGPSFSIVRVTCGRTSFFGYSPVEQIILTINIGLRRQIHLPQLLH